MRNRSNTSIVEATKRRSTEERGPHIITLERARVTVSDNLAKAVVVFIERETLTFEGGKLQSYEYAEVR
jgi:predicted secreted protein